MIHHAVLGSLERFIGMLLEHYEGWLPMWLAPDQVVVASVIDASADYARQVLEAFESGGIRTVIDERSERLQRKVVDAREGGIPILAAVGERDRRDQTVSLRLRDGSQSIVPLTEAVHHLQAEALSPAHRNPT
jgi:threonyl-tRNA synthetase